MNEKELIFIIGMHKSGTSMLGNILQELGYYVGDEDSVLPPAFDNYGGFAERQDINEINDKILELLGCTVFEIKGISSHISFTQKDSVQIGEKIDKILKELFNKSSKVLIKDPRICITLPIWEKYLKDIHVNYMFIYRNPIDVAKSLQNRNSFDNLDDGVKLWDKYNKFALKNIEGKDKIIYTNYEKFLDGPALESERIYTLLPKNSLKEVIEATYTIVEPGMRTNKSEEQLVQFLDELPQYRSTWDTLNNKYSNFTPSEENEKLINTYTELVNPLIMEKSQKTKEILQETDKENKRLNAQYQSSEVEKVRLTEKFKEDMKLTQDHVRNLEAEIENRDIKIKKYEKFLNSPKYLVKRSLLNIKNFLIKN